ncbi:uncharacterized protein LOC425238 isoform X5 [Gallus gallus]|uniref:uncharacterized protein LOC425238 isoform X5 n=1 Tax=Gallus gallus TaxID=9031 RepID=UPI001F00FF79|nr:uncharacterized protein LOC425238 isoform X5 [Gallus gallus]
MTRREVALILGWWLVTVSWAQQLPQPFLSLHPSQGVSLGDTVTLRCHLPRMDAWVQLWHNGTLRFKKEKDKEQDAAEFSFAVTNLEDAGTYQCRYQVSEPLRTSKKSDPVELVLTEPTGAKRWSYVNLLVVVVKVCSALLALSSGLYFYFNGCSLWKRRNESAGVSPEMPESVQFQVSVGVSGPQIPVHFLRPTPHISMETQTFPMGTPNDPQPHMAYPHIYEHHPYPALGKHKPALRGTPAHRYP